MPLFTCLFLAFPDAVSWVKIIFVLPENAILHIFIKLDVSWVLFLPYSFTKQSSHSLPQRAIAKIRGIHVYDVQVKKNIATVAYQ